MCDLIDCTLLPAIKVIDSKVNHTKLFSLEHFYYPDSIRQHSVVGIPTTVADWKTSQVRKCNEIAYA